MKAGVEMNLSNGLESVKACKKYLELLEGQIDSFGRYNKGTFEDFVCEFERLMSYPKSEELKMEVLIIHGEFCDMVVKHPIKNEQDLHVFAKKIRDFTHSINEYMTSK